MRKKIIKNKTLVIATFFVAALFIGTSMNAVLATDNTFESIGPYVVGASEDNSVASDSDDSTYEDEQAKKESRRAYEEEQNSNDDTGVTNDGSGDEGDEKPDEGGDDLSGIEAPDDPEDPIPPIPPGGDSVAISSKEKEIAVKQAIINDLESVNGKLVTVKGSEMIVNIESVEAEAERMVSEAVSANQLDAIYLEVSNNGGETTGIIGCLAASALFGFPSWYCIFSAATTGTTDLSVQSVGVSSLAAQTSETQTTDCPLCAGSSLSESEKQDIMSEVAATYSESEIQSIERDMQSAIEFYHNTYKNLANNEKAALISSLIDEYEVGLSEKQASIGTMYISALQESSSTSSAKIMARASAERQIDINCFPDIGDEDGGWGGWWFDHETGDLYDWYLDNNDGPNGEDPDEDNGGGLFGTGIGNGGLLWFLENILNCLGRQAESTCDELGLESTSIHSQELAMQIVVLKQTQALAQTSVATQTTSVQPSAVQTSTVQTSAVQTSTVQTSAVQTNVQSSPASTAL